MKKLLVALTLIMLCGCTKTVYLDQDGNEIKQVEDSINWWVEDKLEIVKKYDTSLYEIRDIDTGVHYYLYRTVHNGGLTPVYEQDGSIRVTIK